jgi:hypothetical protein
VRRACALAPPPSRAPLPALQLTAPRMWPQVRSAPPLVAHSSTGLLTVPLGCSQFDALPRNGSCSKSNVYTADIHHAPSAGRLVRQQSAGQMAGRMAGRAPGGGGRPKRPPRPAGQQCCEGLCCASASARTAGRLVSTWCSGCGMPARAAPGAGVHLHQHRSVTRAAAGGQYGVYAQATHLAFSAGQRDRCWGSRWRRGRGVSAAGRGRRIDPRVQKKRGGAKKEWSRATPASR